MNYWTSEPYVPDEPGNLWTQEPVNQWTSEPVNMNKRTSEPVDQMKQWPTEWINELANQMKKCTSEKVHQWTSEPMNQCTNESVNQWTSECYEPDQPDELVNQWIGCNEPVNQMKKWTS